LEPREVSAVAEPVVAGLEADLVDTDDVDVELGALVIELSLEVVEVAELATTVASRGVTEVPSGHLAQVIPGRDRLLIGDRGGVDVDQGEVTNFLVFGATPGDHRAEDGGHAELGARHSCSLG